MEITLEEEAPIHALSDSELAVVFAIVEAVEAAECARQECGIAVQGIQSECVEMIGPYTVVQRLRVRLRQLHPGQNPKVEVDNV